MQEKLNLVCKNKKMTCFFVLNAIELQGKSFYNNEFNSFYSMEAREGEYLCL